MLKRGIRYTANFMSMVAKQRGYPTAIFMGARLAIGEIAKLPKYVRLRQSTTLGQMPVMYSEAIVQSLKQLNVPMKEYTIDLAAFQKHITECGYPANYAAGPIDKGGSREQKLLEYFISLDLLQVKAGETVIDVASEWSLFPEVLRKLTGAKVFRQDLIYPPGIHGDRIGGSAAQMPVLDGFADKIVLHNAFEHFEGTADSDFITEARRVLKPGGIVCILPLFLSEQHAIVTDPLVDRRGIVWDKEAQVIEILWWHNRFGRHYDAQSLQKRVLAYAEGFSIEIYHIINARSVHRFSPMHFALVLCKLP